MSDPKFSAIIQAVNEKRNANGIVLEGKKYLQVKDRVEVFRATFGDQYGIDTHVTYDGFEVGKAIIATAKVVDKVSGAVLSSGHAVEFVSSNGFNTVSALESAETSAVGRALAFFGLAGGEFPSADEINGVERKQEAAPATRPQQEPERQRPPSRDVPRMDMDNRRFYQPNYSDPNVELWDEVSKVIDEVSTIKDEAALTRYWNELKEFRAVLNEPNEDPHNIAELKAVFSMVKGRIKGAR